MANGTSFHCPSFLSFFLLGVVGGISSFIAYLFLPGFIDPVAFEVTPVVKFPKNALINSKLSDAIEIPLEGYHGAESLVYTNKTLYTGVDEGEILKIDDSGIRVLATIDSSHKHGRPAGMRLASDAQHLLVVDIFSGVFSVSLINGAHKKLFPVDNRTEITFLNDIDLLPDGNLLVSESSTKYPTGKIFFEVMEGRPNGRLLLVNPYSGEWKELLSDLYFPNGVQLHRDGKSVLIAESTRYRVVRLSLETGKVTLFADGLPGLPDNIRPSPRGGYWVPVSNIRDPTTDSFSNWLSKSPLIRRALFKLYLWFYAGPVHSSVSSMLLRLDEDGHIVEVWKDPKNRVSNVAEVCEVGSELYLSSNVLPHINHLKMSQNN